MSRRSRAREVVVQVLYQDDLNTGSTEDGDRFLTRRLGSYPELHAFARALLRGVRQRREQLDGMLAEVADNWTLDRMAVTDRNIMRLGAFEILHTETPGRVAINEAVELAKRYGTRQSPPFVNGILDKILRLREDNAQGNDHGEGTSSTQ